MEVCLDRGCALTKVSCVYEACSNRGSTKTEVFMFVRKHAPTGVAPKRRYHACTEARSSRGSTLTEVSYVYGGMLQQGLHLNGGLHAGTRACSNKGST